MKGKTMTDIKHINGLYKENGDAIERKDAFVKELKESYNIPDDVMDRFHELDERVDTTWERYKNALSMPWWEIVWFKLTTRNKF
jgi:hypothetical protein